MSACVTFNFPSWLALFPQFGVTTPQFNALAETQVTQLILPLAEQYCEGVLRMTTNKPALQTQLLNLMVSHVAQLLFGSSTQPPSPLVGRISTASEGSVSVGVEFPTTPDNAWFLQTVYGSMFWQLALPFRLGRYAAKVTPQPQFVGGPWWGR